MKSQTKIAFTDNYLVDGHYAMQLLIICMLLFIIDKTPFQTVSLCVWLAKQVSLHNLPELMRNLFITYEESTNDIAPKLTWIV